MKITFTRETRIKIFRVLNIISYMFLAGIQIFSVMFHGNISFFNLSTDEMMILGGYLLLANLTVIYFLSKEIDDCSSMSGRYFLMMICWFMSLAWSEELLLQMGIVTVGIVFVIIHGERYNLEDRYSSESGGV